MVDRLSLAEANDAAYGPPDLSAALREGRDAFTLFDGRDIAPASLRFVEGAGAQLVGREVDVTFGPYYENVVERLIAMGSIDDGSRPGSYDDRKFRFSGLEVTANGLTVHVGPTWYQWHREDIGRKEEDALERMARGLDTGGTAHYHFARTLGVTIAIVTRQGSVFIAPRNGTVDRSGELAFIGGCMTFQPTLEGVRVEDDLARELEEEADITWNSQITHLEFVGVAGHALSGEVDLTFVARSTVDEAHFVDYSGAEHESWIRIGDRRTCERVLDRACGPLMYPSVIVMEYLRDTLFS